MMQQNGDHTLQIRARLTVLVEQAGQSFEGLSKLIGRNPSYIRDFVKRGHPRQLHESDRLQLSELLGCDESELRAPGPQRAAPSVGMSRAPGKRAGDLTPVPVNRKIDAQFYTDAIDLPIRGALMLGSKIAAYSFGEADTLGFTLRPASLRGVPDAYAVEIADNLMAPAFKQRFLAWIHPRRTTTPGDDVVLHFKDGTFVVRNLIAHGETSVTVQQYNPARTTKIPMSEVRSIHLIVGSTRAN